MSLHNHIYIPSLNVDIPLCISSEPPTSNLKPPTSDFRLPTSTHSNPNYDTAWYVHYYTVLV
ncbi:hypothetical protein L873DRAFT_1813124 [Choiromyces venosus 120613-1]|uniref:Uncharacterized protein n=1 Tax=Choiromyces venosus 120613-1 TaxID=1336337 RepID=A0A3N4JA99_9PEZI|nr:hypothetical protein L873DRAFT_1813124 [Choiromyces venosus 120613-1]